MQIQIPGGGRSPLQIYTTPCFVYVYSDISIARELLGSTAFIHLDKMCIYYMYIFFAIFVVVIWRIGCAAVVGCCCAYVLCASPLGWTDVIETSVPASFTKGGVRYVYANSLFPNTIFLRTFSFA